jgi:hypothetical protein
MARRDAAGVRLLTRNGHDFAKRFPTAAAAVAALSARSLPCARGSVLRAAMFILPPDVVRRACDHARGRSLAVSLLSHSVGSGFPRAFIACSASGPLWTCPPWRAVAPPRLVDPELVRAARGCWLSGYWSRCATPLQYSQDGGRSRNCLNYCERKTGIGVMRTVASGISPGRDQPSRGVHDFRTFRERTP